MILQVLQLETVVRNYRSDPSAAESLAKPEEKPNDDELNKPLNCSDPDVLVKPIPFLDEQWKNKVVIGCTVAVALEVLIVLLMVMYWKQIRWTLRKLACPCDRMFHRRHEPLQRQENTYETNVDLESDDDSVSVDQEMQIYAPTRHDHTSDGSATGPDRGHTSSSVACGYSHIGFPSDSTNRFSHYTNDGGDDDDDDNDDEVSARRTCTLAKPMEKNHLHRYPEEDTHEQGTMMHVYAIVHNYSDDCRRIDT